MDIKGSSLHNFPVISIFLSPNIVKVVRKTSGPKRDKLIPAKVSHNQVTMAFLTICSLLQQPSLMPNITHVDLWWNVSPPDQTSQLQSRWLKPSLLAMQHHQYYMDHQRSYQNTPTWATAYITDVPPHQLARHLELFAPLPQHMRHHNSNSSLTQRPHSHLERHKCPSNLLRCPFNSVLLKETLQLLEQQFRTDMQDPLQLMLTHVYFPFNGTFYDMKEHHCLPWLWMIMYFTQIAWMSGIGHAHQ